jgi:hypothetical protein
MKADRYPKSTGLNVSNIGDHTYKTQKPIPQFLFQEVRYARWNFFFPTSWLRAVWFVIRNWTMLRRLERGRAKLLYQSADPLPQSRDRVRELTDS